MRVLFIIEVQTEQCCALRYGTGVHALCSFCHVMFLSLCGYAFFTRLAAGRDHEFVPYVTDDYSDDNNNDDEKKISNG